MERDNNFQYYHSRETQESQSRSRILITMPYGIGDVIYIGLTAVDQVVKNDPEARIDILCNNMQFELFSSDPRIDSIVVAEKTLFPTSDNFTFQKAMSIDERVESLLRFLKDQHYDAVLPGNVAFHFAHRLGAKVMYPDIPSIVRDYLTLRRFGDAPASRRIRFIINRYFGNKLLSPAIDEEIPLYINPAYIERAKTEVVCIRAQADSDDGTVAQLALSAQ